MAWSGGLDALFVVPSLSAAARYGELRSSAHYAAPQGLLSIIACLRANCFSARLLDADALGLDLNETVNRILAMRPGAVGISAVTMSMSAAGRLAASIKQRTPDVVTLCGGPHPSALPEATLRDWPGIDAVVIGEGENTFVEFMKDRDRPIAGLAVRRGGEILSGPAREQTSDLDSLPLPAWDAVSNIRIYRPSTISVRRRPAMGLVTMRGCPFACVFCSHAVFGRRVRFNGVEWILRSMEALRSLGVREIQFNDDDFLLDRARAGSFCERLIRDRAGWSWSCSTRPDELDAELLRTAKRAGMWQVSFGIESGDEAMLARMGKGINLDGIRRAVETARKAGVLVKGFFIVGFPSETAESLARTERFALSLPLSALQVAHFVPVPGSPAFQSAGEGGDIDNDWDKWSGAYPIYVPRGLRGEDLRASYRRMMIRFYTRPRVALRLAARFLRHGDFAELGRGALSAWRLLRSMLTSRFSERKIT